jgi:aromatic-L-amino-acid decarboxylase
MALDDKLDLANYAYEALSRDPRLKVIDQPQLSTVPFRAMGCDNRALLRRINATGHALLSGTLLDGQMALRLCVLSFRTQRRHVDDALRAIQENL